MSAISNLGHGLILQGGTLSQTWDIPKLIRMQNELGFSNIHLHPT